MGLRVCGSKNVTWVKKVTDKIKLIENLETLIKLEFISLNNNFIEKIENLEKYQDAYNYSNYRAFCVLQFLRLILNKY